MKPPGDVIVIPAQGETYVLIETQCSISDEKLQELRRSWASLINHNDNISLKFFYYSIDGFPREIR